MSFELEETICLKVLSALIRPARSIIRWLDGLQAGQCAETNSLLPKLLRDSEIISKTKIEPLLLEAESITNILTFIVKTTQNSKLKT